LRDEQESLGPDKGRGRPNYRAAHPGAAGPELIRSKPAGGGRAADRPELLAARGAATRGAILMPPGRTRLSGGGPRAAGEARRGGRRLGRRGRGDSRGRGGTRTRIPIYTRSGTGATNPGHKARRSRAWPGTHGGPHRHAQQDDFLGGGAGARDGALASVRGEEEAGTGSETEVWAGGG